MKENNVSLNVGDDSRKKEKDREHHECARKCHSAEPMRLQVLHPIRLRVSASSSQSDCKNQPIPTNQIARLQPIARASHGSRLII